LDGNKNYKPASEYSLMMTIK